MLTEKENRKAENRWFRGFLAFSLLGLMEIMVFASISRADAWKLKGDSWTENDEKVYQSLVQNLGESHHNSLNDFLHDPNQNPLFSEADKKLKFSPDCADLPFILRAYTSKKLGKPFSFVSRVSGKGGDPRFSAGNKPSEKTDQSDFSSPESLFDELPKVHSGMFRMDPDVPDGDTYPVKIQPDSIRPGTIYYDPAGHVAIVYKVTPDGRIGLVDSHPDKTFTRTPFGPKFDRGPKETGGGFRRWRPTSSTQGKKPGSEKNENIKDFSPSDQYRDDYKSEAGKPLDYFDYVRETLSEKGKKVNPVQEFRKDLEDLFQDVQNRAKTVDNCIEKNIPSKKHPGKLPKNIYGTKGEWEEFSTPSRDARLKRAFKETFNKVQSLVAMAENHDPRLDWNDSPGKLAKELLDDLKPFASQNKISYKNSDGKSVSLDFQDISDRLFKFSFDPYHSPELRWGAEGNELSSANDDAGKKEMYDREKTLRNNLERKVGCETKLTDGPAKSPDIDIKKWLEDYVEKHPDDKRPAETVFSKFLGLSTEELKPVIRTAFDETWKDFSGWSFLFFLLLMLRKGNAGEQEERKSLKNPGLNAEVTPKADGSNNIPSVKLPVKETYSPLHPEVNFSVISELLVKFEKALAAHLPGMADSDLKLAMVPVKAKSGAQSPSLFRNLDPQRVKVLLADLTKDFRNRTTGKFTSGQELPFKDSDPDNSPPSNASLAENSDKTTKGRTLKLQIRLDETKMNMLGLADRDILQTLRHIFGDGVSIDSGKNRRTVHITTQSHEKETEILRKMENLQIFSQETGAAMPLWKIGEISKSNSDQGRAL